MKIFTDSRWGTAEGRALAQRWIDATTDEAIKSLLIKDFDESQHPREANGRFGSGDGESSPAKTVVQNGVESIVTKPVSFLKSSIAPLDYASITAISKEQMAALAKAYEAAPHDDPAAHEAYAALAKEVEQQYKELTGPLGVKVDFVTSDPYANVEELRKDLEENHHLAVLKTETTVDSSGAHPYFTNEQNDMFRAVHDAFGHAASGRGFDRNGEEAAYQAHRSMFSDLATKALATETRSQNSCLITNGTFPDQKVALMPDELIKRLRQIADELLSKAAITADDDNLYSETKSHHVSMGRTLSKSKATKSLEEKMLIEIRKARLALKPMLKEWDESAHPRAANGRFGSGEGSSDPTKDVGPKMFAGEKHEKGKSSLYDHLVSDGKGGYKLTPERQALHDQIIAKALAGVPVSSNPTVTMLGGGPAAGKSVATENPTLGIPKTSDSSDVKSGAAQPTAVLVNADLVKEQLPEYQAMGASGVHEESSLIAKEIYAQALAHHQDVVYDGTGNSSMESLQGKIDAGRDAGYTVNGVYVTCPTDLAWDRAQARADKTGREVPEGMLRETHANVSGILPEAAPLFDSTVLVDSTKGAVDEQGRTSGEIIASGSLGQDLSVHNPEAYSEFLAKANEDTTPKGRTR